MVCGDGGVSFLATKDRSCRSVGMDECFFSHKGQEMHGVWGWVSVFFCHKGLEMHGVWGWMSVFFSHRGQELQECGMGECLF